MHSLVLNKEEAAALEKLIRYQVMLYREAEEGILFEPPEPFTGGDLESIEPLLPLLATISGAG